MQKTNCDNHYPNAVEAKWYCTYSPFLNLYPRVTTPKLYSIAREDLEKELPLAAELVRNGNIITVKL